MFLTYKHTMTMKENNGKLEKYGHIYAGKQQQKKITTAPMLEKNAKLLVHHFNAYTDMKVRVKHFIKKWNP